MYPSLRWLVIAYNTAISVTGSRVTVICVCQMAGDMLLITYNTAISVIDCDLCVQQVQVIFRSPREVAVRDQPIFKCHVIEPSLGDGGEIIANIPVKVSVKSVFSK